MKEKNVYAEFYIDRATISKNHGQSFKNLNYVFRLLYYITLHCNSPSCT